MFTVNRNRERPSQLRAATYIDGFIISAVKRLTCQKNNEHSRVNLKTYPLQLKTECYTIAISPL
jgi:hypothetical protein